MPIFLLSLKQQFRILKNLTEFATGNFAKITRSFPDKMSVLFFAVSSYFQHGWPRKIGLENYCKNNECLIYLINFSNFPQLCFGSKQYPAVSHALFKEL